VNLHAFPGILYGLASDIFDRRTVIAVSLFIGGGFCFAIVLVPVPGFGALSGLTIVYDGITYAIYPIAVSHTNNYLDPTDLVNARAGLIMAMAIGAVLGPLFTSLIMEWVGPNGLFVFSVGTCLVLGGFGLFRMECRAARSMEEQGPHVLVSRTEVVSAELDPRAGLGDVEGGPVHAELNWDRLEIALFRLLRTRSIR